MAKTNTQPKQQPATQAAPAPTRMAATVAALNGTPPVTSSAAAPVKKPAVQYVNGQAVGAPPNAPTLKINGAPLVGSIAATNPANRGAANPAAFALPKAWQGTTHVTLVKPCPTTGPNPLNVACGVAVNNLFAKGSMQPVAAVFAAVQATTSSGAQQWLAYRFNANQFKAAKG
jgi:hypothetical protein